MCLRVIEIGVEHECNGAIFFWVYVCEKVQMHRRRDTFPLLFGNAISWYAL